MSNKTIESFEKIKKEILNKKFSPVYFLCGEENYYIDEIADLLEAQVLTPEEKNFNLTISYGKEISALEIKMACKRFPLMSKHQLIIIKDAQNVASLEALEDYVTNPMPETILVLCYRNKTLDKRKSFAKMLSKHTFFVSEQMRDYEIISWITSYFKVKNRSIEPKAIQLISEFVGTNLGTLKSEIDKMLINIKDSVTIINMNHVEENIGVSKEYNFFELQKALGSKNFNKSVQIANYFISTEAKHFLLGGIAILMGFFSKIHICHVISNKSKMEIAQILGINNYFVPEYLEACKNYSRGDIETILGYLKYYDLRAKGVNDTNTKEGQLLIELVVKILKVNDIRREHAVYGKLF